MSVMCLSLIWLRHDAYAQSAARATVLLLSLDSTMLQSGWYAFPVSMSPSSFTSTSVTLCAIVSQRRAVGDDVGSSNNSSYNTESLRLSLCLVVQAEEAASALETEPFAAHETLLEGMHYNTKAST
jgi:hypothetical protein